MLGPEAVPLAFRLNGQERRLEVEPRRTLADVLRVDLGLAKGATSQRSALLGYDDVGRERRRCP